MEGFGAGFLLKAVFNPHCGKALMCGCFLPFLLLMAPLSPPPMPAILGHALGGFLEGSALPFLLLNCVIVTIFGSAKLDGGEGKAHEEVESQRQYVAAMSLISERVEGIPLVGNHGGEQSLSYKLSTPPKPSHAGYEHNPSGRRDFLRRSRSWSFYSSSDCKNKHEQRKAARHQGMQEKKPNSSTTRARQLATPASMRRSCTGKVGLHQNQLLSLDDSQKKQPASTRGSFHRAAASPGSHHEKPPLALTAVDDTSAHIEQSGRERSGPAVLAPVDRPPRQAQKRPGAAPSATVAHPSMDEVWVAVMASKMRDDRNNMPFAVQTEMKRTRKRNSKPFQRAAAQLGTTPSLKAVTDATASRIPPLAPAPPRTAATPLPGAPRAAPPAATKEYSAAKAENRLDAEQHDRETVEELNRRAEEFIQRFNQQMRRQRYEVS